MGFNLSSAKKLAQALKSSTNVEELLLSQIGDPQTKEMAQLMKMVKNRDMRGMEQMARQTCKEQGIDIDELIRILKNN